MQAFFLSADFLNFISILFFSKQVLLMGISPVSNILDPDQQDIMSKLLAKVINRQKSPHQGIKS